MCDISGGERPRFTLARGQFHFGPKRERGRSGDGELEETRGQQQSELEREAVKGRVLDMPSDLPFLHGCSVERLPSVLADMESAPPASRESWERMQDQLLAEELPDQRTQEADRERVPAQVELEEAKREDLQAQAEEEEQEPQREGSSRRGGASGSRGGKEGGAAVEE